MRHKFTSKRTQVDDISFPSKLEARCYKELKKLQDENIVIFFQRQPMFDLPGGIKHRVDFLVFCKSGDAIFLEAKGRDHSDGILRRKLVESLYPVKIHVVKSESEIKDIVKEKRQYLAAPYYDC